MSTAEETQVEAELRDSGLLIREFVVRDMAVTGRTVDVLLVPFGEVARVADPPRFEPYNEEWMPGVFDHQQSAANRIHAKYGHSESVLDVVGHGIALTRDSTGYRMATKIHETVQGETALELLRDDALPCVSLEARPVKSIRDRGIVQRVKANLSGFAFCRQGAFAGARVLAIREEIVAETIIDAELLPTEINPELVERCRRLGLKLPHRYQAHPEGTDTPAEAGTSEDGTSHAHDGNQTQEEAT